MKPLRLSTRWQLAGFAAAILIPSVILVVVGQRTIRQSRELRQADVQRAVRDGIARELLARLESLKATVLSNPQTADPRLALVAEVDSGRLLPPWETDPAVRRLNELKGRPPFSTALARAQQAENSPGDARDAVRAYRESISAAEDPLQAAYARLLLARLLTQRGRAAEAAVEARAVLASPPSFVDEDGLPLAIGAAAILAGSAADRPAVIRAVNAALDQQRWLSGLATYALSNLAGQLEALPGDADRDLIRRLRDRTAAAIRAQEQFTDLQNDTAQQATLAAWAGSGAARWALFRGAEPWLLAEGERPDGPPLVVAVIAEKAFQPLETFGARFLAPADAGGMLLGDAFPSVRIAVPLAELPEGASFRMQSTLYYLVLFLIVGATGFGAAVLLRSLRSEVRLAETRAQFVSSVSHELKTPLTAIRMFAETLEMRHDQDEQLRRDYLETIVNECGRLSRLVDDVLLFSRIEQGKKIYRFRPVDLAGAARSVARILSYQLAQHGFDLSLDLEEEVPPVPADPDALEQAIINLVTNAMKYSGESRRIELRLARNGNSAELSVTDYGAGIAPEEHGRIFEKYYRVATVENQSIPGTGLGLTLVSQIAKAHNGTVEVRSAPGKGSTFLLRLPFGDS